MARPRLSSFFGLATLTFFAPLRSVVGLRGAACDAERVVVTARRPRPHSELRPGLPLRAHLVRRRRQGAASYRAQPTLAGQGRIQLCVCVCVCMCVCVCVCVCVKTLGQKVFQLSGQKQARDK